MKNYLLLDIGNTMIDAYIRTSKKDYFFAVRREGDCSSSLDAYLKKFDESYTNDLVIYLSSVNRPAEKKVYDFYKSLGVQVFALDSKVMEQYVNKYGIDVPNISILGGDLFADIIGGTILQGSRELIADFGTASKVLLVENKKFIGGSIFPGVYNCSKMLSEKTDLLEFVEMKMPKNKFSLDTDEAINSGAIYGTALMLRGWYEQLVKENPNFPIKLTITGGAGDIISEALHSLGFKSFTYDRLRIIRGLSRAFELNVLKEDL